MKAKCFARTVLLAGLGLALALLAPGCTTVMEDTSEISLRAKEFPDPPEGVAGVYLYRPNRFQGSFLGWDCWIDDRYIGELPNGAFIYCTVPPGKHHAKWHWIWGGAELDFVAKEGENVCLRAWIESGFWTTKSLFNRVHPSDARPAIQRLRLAVLLED